MNKIVIQHLTLQVLTIKNSTTEMNHELRKMETPDNKTTHNLTPRTTLSQEQKVNQENLKRIVNSEKTTLPS